MKATMTADTSRTPAVAHQRPLTRRRERPSARAGPTRSTSSAGAATDQAAYSQTPGTTSAMNPSRSPIHMSTYMTPSGRSPMALMGPRYPARRRASPRLRQGAAPVGSPAVTAGLSEKAGRSGAAPPAPIPPFTREHQDFRQAVRRYVETELRPHADE